MVHLNDIQKQHNPIKILHVCKKENESVLGETDKSISDYNLTDLLNINIGEKATSLERIIAKEKGMQIMEDVQESGAPKCPLFT